MTAYSLDNIDLPRPKSLQREFVFIKSDISSLTGKISRDVTLLKEKYLISWDIISVTDASNLLSIVNKNKVVIFFVDDKNLQISSTSVHVYIASQGYKILGSNYISSLILELIEEE